MAPRIPEPLPEDEGEFLDFFASIQPQIGEGIGENSRPDYSEDEDDA